MDTGTLLGLLVGAGVPFIGALIAIGRAFQKLAGHDQEIADLKDSQEQFQARLAETEKVRADVGGLTAAVKSLGELFGEKLNGLADKLAFHNDSSSRRLDDMKKDTERRFDDLNERLSERRTFRTTDK